MSFKCLLLIPLLIYSSYLQAQTDTDSFIEVIIESVAENAGEDFDYSELAERLNFYRKNPINLNKTTGQALQELLFLSPLQISQIISYRDKNGKFLELYELQAIDGLDVETIRKLVSFVTLGEINPLKDITLKKLIYNGSNDVMFTMGQIIEQQQGYSTPAEDKSHYLGSPQRFLTRYRYHYGQNLSASVTMEKDAGEKFFSAKQTAGFDFYSGSIFYKNDGFVQKIAVGDYLLQFGQGLTLWSGLSFGKGAAVSTIIKNEIGLKPYSSTNEALFLRGFATTLQAKQIEFTPFVSYKPVDASLAISELNGETAIGSINQTGLHRTSNELKNKNAINQLIFGANLQYAYKSLRLGLTSYQTSFSKSFEPGDQLYNAKDFASDKLTNIGAYYSYAYHNIYFFGEAAHSINSGSAFLNGALLSLTPQVALVMFHRSYSRDYHSFFNQAIAESSAATNEKGFYSGLVITPNKKYDVSTYVDFFRFPWMRFRVDAPSTGYEIFSQFTYSPTKRFKTSIRYKFESKQENDALENTTNFLEQLSKQNYRLEISYKVNDVLQLRSRAEVVQYKKSQQELGYLLFQDINYNPIRSKFSANFRFGIFDTEGFNSRIYAYESDVLYGFSAPAYQNKGIRFYANSRYRINRNTDVWLKYAITNYSTLDEIGSGLDKISGSNKSDIKLQLRLQF